MSAPLRIPGVPTPVSPIVLGTGQVELSGAHLPDDSWPRLWDEAVDLGITALDTATHYGARTERLLGCWLEATGVRERLVLVHKVAHTPECTPEAVERHLSESLERLRTDHVDVLILHRDSAQTPAGEFAEALQAEVRAGRALATGVSNWTIDRVGEYAAAAADRGLPGPAVLSNQLSLAEMIEPVWPGCVCAFRSQEQLASLQLPLLAWSATGRGYFGGRHADDEVRRCWDGSENAARRERAHAVAAGLGVEASTVALAWLLARPFPTAAIVGSKDSGELATALAALRIEASLVRDLHG